MGFWFWWNVLGWSFTAGVFVGGRFVLWSLERRLKEMEKRGVRWNG